MFLLLGAPKGWESQISCQNQKMMELCYFFSVLIKYSKMELLWVFGGHGPEMDSRTYEKGQELLLFLHAGGKAPVLGKISKNVKIIEFLENHRIL